MGGSLAKIWPRRAVSRSLDPFGYSAGVLAGHWTLRALFSLLRHVFILQVYLTMDNIGHVGLTNCEVEVFSQEGAAREPCASWLI